MATSYHPRGRAEKRASGRWLSGFGLAFACAFVMACSDAASERPSSTGTSSGGSGGAATTTGNSATGGSTSGSGGGSGGSATTGSGTAGSSTTGGASGASGAGGATGGTAGSGGNGGAGGSSGGAGSGVDGGGGGKIDAGAESGPGDASFPPITECPNASVDRLQQWMASGEGVTVPPTGNTLVMDGGRYVSKIQFVGNEWHVMPVYLGNTFNAQADLSASSGFMLTYSSTSNMYVQVRPASHWDGGNQYATMIPSTGGVVKSQFFSFAKENWKSIFQDPGYPYETALKEARAFVFVGQTPNTIVFSGLRIDGYVPPCR